ncbi:MAG: lipoprotein insertase outer membrane protein LolB [Ottowia sp.]|uniref:lipoprotein insertase outer membrane protein LolB n=2 Tax=unclassified Ottowia TaxID=2645081 RepID=UPI003C7876FD
MRSPKDLPLSRRQAAQALLLATAALAAGCASTSRETRAIDTERTSWSGRLGLRVASEPPQSFSAGFSLNGNAQAGELSLTSPLGSTLAVMKWQPGAATLNQDGKEKQYSSLDELVAQAIGTPIPVRALFAWLRGEPQAVEGWQTDLSALGNGRLTAQRLQPLPTAELRLVFE